MSMLQFNQKQPQAYAQIEQFTKEVGFTMPADISTGAFLKTLAATKPQGNFLELGTGTGLSTCWMLDGMDSRSTLTSIDNNQDLVAIAKQFLGHDPRLELTCMDGGAWIEKNKHLRFDYIFADTWPGKYFQLNEVLLMLRKGGMYIIDDMLPQSNWPEGHAEKATALINDLENRPDLVLTKLNWSTGIIVAVKII